MWAKPNTSPGTMQRARLCAKSLYRIGVQRIAKEPEEAQAGVGAVEGAVFGLFGLLIAFTFSGAASRFDTRR